MEHILFRWVMAFKRHSMKAAAHTYTNHFNFEIKSICRFAKKNVSAVQELCTVIIAWIFIAVNYRQQFHFNWIIDSFTQKTASECLRSWNDCHYNHYRSICIWRAFFLLVRIFKCIQKKKQIICMLLIRLIWEKAIHYVCCVHVYT